MKGGIQLDGQEIKNIKYVSSYVMQEEVYLGSLTVKENITYSANLNIEKQKENHDQFLQERIESIIKEFGLTKV